MKSTIATAMAATILFSFTAGCAAQPPANEEKSAGQETASESLSPAGLMNMTGTVEETMDAASYTYVRVNTGSDEFWAATGRFEVEVGDRVTVPLDTPMENFHSEALNRDFPVIYFATSILREGETAQKLSMMPAGHPPINGSAPAAESATVQPVEAAEGGITVAEIWNGRDQLAGSAVTVRGRVVKFNGGILGRNWMHIQDGTGDRTQGTHDLTVTSDGIAAVGDVVTITGTVAVDEDFGAGYIYPVLVEDASVESE